MRRTDKTLSPRAIGVFLCLTAVAIGAQEEEIDRLLEGFSQGKEYFRAFVEQDGTIFGSTEGAVGLERRSFTLVLVFKEPLGVLTNFSFQDTVCRGFRAQKPLDEILQKPDHFMGMAEELLNPEERIVIDDVTPHYLFYDSKENHRFSHVSTVKGIIVCRRKITCYSYLGSISEKMPIEQIESSRLFISLLYSQYGKNYQRIERQKECIEIRFE
jgi:hypothetical protein